MIKRFASTSVHIGVAVIGFACALLVLEIQRMPAVQHVNFSMFAPAPYFVEVALILVLAAVYGAKKTLRISASPVARAGIAAFAAVFSLVVASGVSLPGEAAVLVIQSLYRIGSACLLLFGVSVLSGLVLGGLRWCLWLRALSQERLRWYSRCLIKAFRI